MKKEWVEVLVTKCKGKTGEWEGDTLLELNLPVDIVEGKKLNMRLLLEQLSRKLTDKEWDQFLRDNELQQLTENEKKWIIDSILSLLESDVEYSEKIGRKEYWRRCRAIEKGNLKEEAWNWKYGTDKKELKIMKSLYQKLR